MEFNVTVSGAGVLMTVPTANALATLLEDYAARLDGAQALRVPTTARDQMTHVADGAALLADILRTALTDAFAAELAADARRSSSSSGGPMPAAAAAAFGVAAAAGAGASMAEDEFILDESKPQAPDVAYGGAGAGGSDVLPPPSLVYTIKNSAIPKIRNRRSYNGVCRDPYCEDEACCDDDNVLCFCACHDDMPLKTFTATTPKWPVTNWQRWATCPCVDAYACRGRGCACDCHGDGDADGTESE